MSIITDNTVLVHIYSGLESKNKITLGLLVALIAEKNDHKVTLFLAGDGVQILNLSLIHISEPTRLGMISYAVFCLKKKT